MSCPPEILGKTQSYVSKTKWQEQVSAVELIDAWANAIVPETKQASVVSAKCGIL
jgi:hypothetical protein